MEKVDRMQEQMSNVSRDMEIPRKNQKEKAEMKNTFDGFITKLTTDEERISKLEDLSIELSKWTEYPRIVGKL